MPKKSGVNLIDVVDGANRAEYTLNIAHDLVRNAIGGDGADVDELLTISCVLDRVAAELRNSTAIADKLRGTQQKAEAPNA